MNTKNVRKLFCTVVLSCVVLGSTRAQYAEDVLRFSQFGLGVGARSMGMGNAVVGLADDYSALFWNPAGLAQSRSYEFSMGLSYLGYNNSTTFLGSKTKAASDAVNLNNLGIVYPVPTTRGSLTFALGFNRVANYTTTSEFSGYNPGSSIILSMIPNSQLPSSPSERQSTLDNNIPFQLYLADIVNNRLTTNITGNVDQKVKVHEGGGVNHWSFGGAMDVAKDLSLGASVSIADGSYDYERQYEERDINNVYMKAPSDTLGLFDKFSMVSTVHSDMSGFNAVFGLLYRRQGKFRVGVTVRTPTYYTIKENFSDDASSRFDPNLDGSVDQYSVTFDGKTEYRVITPMVLTFGASVQFRDWLVLAGDVEYTDWKQMRFDTDVAELRAENRLIKGVYRSTFNLRGGAEVTLWDLGVKLRGGAVLNPSPYEGDPPSYDQLYYTGGFEIELEENAFLNAAYAYGTSRTFRDNYSYGTAPASRTDEHIKTHNLNLTLSFRF